METLVWLRVPGDIVFSAGAAVLAVFAVRLMMSGRRRRAVASPATAALPAE